MRTSSVQKSIRWSDVYFVSKIFVKRKDQIVKTEDILMSMANSYELVGKVARVTETPYPAAFGAFLAAIRPSEITSSAFLFNFLRTDDVQQKLREGSSQTTNIANISIARLSEIPLPLPPLAEQIRIADKLDVLLSRVDAGRERLERVPKLVKRFRQSVLSAAVSGELTREWRGGGEMTVQETPLGNIARFIDYRGKTPDKKTHGIPLITAKNIRKGYLSEEPREYIAESDYDAWMTRGFPQLGDVLITTEAPMGNVCVINWDYKFALAQRSICLQFDAAVIGTFAAIMLQSEGFQDALKGQSSGSTVEGIKAARMKEIEVAYPPLPEQAEIVRRVESLFALADRLEARAQAALARYARLTPALLAKAFRGELVPQDPADEPASVLLERIRAQREAAGPVKKVAGHGRKSGATTPRTEDGAQTEEAQSEPKRGRGRPSKVQQGAGQSSRGIPVAASAEEAIRLLEERARAEREGKVTVQAGLFGN